ncbi:hypothetical protein LPJ62_004872, partial [Coemansia sp. RSA 2167]
MSNILDLDQGYVSSSKTVDEWISDCKSNKSWVVSRVLVEHGGYLQNSDSFSPYKGKRIYFLCVHDGGMRDTLFVT